MTCILSRIRLSPVVETVVRETGQTAFQHFWDDGIFERGPQAAEKSIRRRKILIAISDVLSEEKRATKAAIITHSLTRNIASLESDLKEFVTRKILVYNTADDSYRFKVPLFEKWLGGKGIQDIIATFSDLDAALQERQKEEESKVQHDELAALLQKWDSPYKGQMLTEGRVRS